MLRYRKHVLRFEINGTTRPPSTRLNHLSVIPLQRKQISITGDQVTSTFMLLIPHLKPYDGIFKDVGAVDCLSHLSNVGVFSDEEPSHVSEEPSAVHVVWISVGLGALVMNPVVPDPLMNVVLKRRQRMLPFLESSDCSHFRRQDRS